MVANFLSASSKLNSDDEGLDVDEEVEEPLKRKFDLSLKKTFTL